MNHDIILKDELNTEFIIQYITETIKVNEDLFKKSLKEEFHSF